MYHVFRMLGGLKKDAWSISSQICAQSLSVLLIHLAQLTHVQLLLLHAHNI